jgi:phospholipid/cholesterol/gamma-HCH transport system substrate-binding protein
MDERRMQLRIGLMVLGIAIIVAILLFTFGGQENPFDYFRAKNVFYVKFPEAPSVTEDTPVRKSGVRIGRVAKVRLSEEVGGIELDDGIGAVVTIQIDRNRRIFNDEICLIKRNLLGDAVLEFTRTTDAPPVKEVEKPGGWLTGKVQSDPVQLVGNLESDLLTALKSVAETSDEIRNFMEKMNAFLGTEEELAPKQERLNNILDRALTTMESMDRLAKNANDVIGKQEVKDAVDQFPLVIQDVRDTLGHMTSTLDGIDESVHLVNRNLRNIEGFTEPLGEQGPVVIERLDRGAQKLEQLMGEMYTFSQALNSGNGTVGRLVHDDELYENLNSTVANIEALAEKLEPVIWNAQVFSDKIARHPELLGVRGALQRSPGTKGVPRFSELEKTSFFSRPSESPRISQPR